MIQTPAIRPHLQYRKLPFNMRFGGDTDPNHVTKRKIELTFLNALPKLRGRFKIYEERFL